MLPNIIMSSKSKLKSKRSALITLVFLYLYFTNFNRKKRLNPVYIILPHSAVVEGGASRWWKEDLLRCWGTGGGLKAGVRKSSRWWEREISKEGYSRMSDGGSFMIWTEEFLGCGREELLGCGKLQDNCSGQPDFRWWWSNHTTVVTHYCRQSAITKLLGRTLLISKLL